jgi:hypothetical protein
MTEPNPFEVLRLDPSATEEEVVRQAARLRQRATDEASLNAVRRAVQTLTGSAEARTLHALLTHPRPSYASPALDRLAAAFRRPPAATAPPSCPPFDQAEFSALVCAASAGELELPPLEFAGVPAGEGAEEIRRQTAEVLAQSLLFDPRG